MHKGRLEAFSDGVIAIVLTIMVLELRPPKEATLSALSVLWPIWVAYGLSYFNVFLVWLNHHDIFAGVAEVDRRLLIANGALLFCVSLIPFATAFAGEEHWSAPLPASIYGLVMCAVSMAFASLRLAAANLTNDAELSVHHRREARRSSVLAALFVTGAALGWFQPRLALLVFVAIPVILRLTRRELQLPGERES